MALLGENRWGKSEVRVSKVHPSDGADSFTDLTVRVLLQGEVERAHTEGDNSGVLPTDTMRNTVYGLAQDHLTSDLEAFAALLCDHFLARETVTGSSVSIQAKRWDRVGPSGFVGGGSERRTARVVAGRDEKVTRAGIEGLVVLKTSGSSFTDFPRDEFTILPEAEDRILATSMTVEWRYEPVPGDTTAAWELGRAAILDSFFSEWSASVQHQGWMMASALLTAVPEIAEADFRLPNQHHLPFDLTRFGLEDRGVVFQPVTEPHGDIRLTVTR
jgi:urate oxidase